MNQSLKYLNQIVKVKIDRPLGSVHPKYDFKYSVNYGFIPNTVSGDGEEIDVYVLGVNKPVENFEGKCIAIIHRTSDNDDKLIVIPKDRTDISDKEIKQATYFQEQYFQSEIIR